MAVTVSTNSVANSNETGPSPHSKLCLIIKSKNCLLFTSINFSLILLSVISLFLIDTFMCKMIVFSINFSWNFRSNICVLIYKVNCRSEYCKIANSVCVKRGWLSKYKCECKEGFYGKSDSFCDGWILSFNYFLVLEYLKH